MKAYGYIAYTDSGKRRRGTVVAESEAQAARQLQDQGLFVSQLSGGKEQASDQGAPNGGRRRRWRGGGQPNAAQTAGLTRPRGGRAPPVIRS